MSTSARVNLEPLAGQERIHVFLDNLRNGPALGAVALVVGVLKLVKDQIVFLGVARVSFMDCQLAAVPETRECDDLLARETSRTTGSARE